MVRILRKVPGLTVVVEPGGIEHAVLAGRGPGRVKSRPIYFLRGRLEADPATRQVRHATGSGARSGARADSAAVMRSPVVTAPSEADETSAAYLAMTPPL